MLTILNPPPLFQKENFFENYEGESTLTLRPPGGQRKEKVVNS